jgi:hypothetical protein
MGQLLANASDEAAKAIAAMICFMGISNKRQKILTGNINKSRLRKRTAGGVNPQGQSHAVRPAAVAHGGEGSAHAFFKATGFLILELRRKASQA